VAWRRPRPGTGRGPLGEQVGHGERRALRVDAVVIGQHGHREPLAREAEHGQWNVAQSPPWPTVNRPRCSPSIRPDAYGTAVPSPNAPGARVCPLDAATGRVVARAEWVGPADSIAEAAPRLAAQLLRSGTEPDRGKRRRTTRPHPEHA
jgi:hypothetical protein